MNLLESIINQFSQQYTVLINEDKYDSAHFKIQTNQLNIKSLEDLRSVVKNIPDPYLIDVFDVDLEDNITLRRDHLESDYIKLSKLDFNKEFTIDIKIDKSTDEGNVSIYSLQKFILFIKSFNLEEILDILEFNTTKIKNFILIDANDNETLTTDSISFSPNGKEIPIIKGQSIENRQLRESNCSFLDSSRFRFTPEDFTLINRSKNEELNALFDKLSLIFSIISIANISSIKGDKLEYSIEGYRRIKGEIDFNNLNTDILKQLLGIYKWTYEGGNFVDKLGIVRNLIPLNINKSITELTEDIIHAVQSNHNIYLKENVNRYIEVKQTIVTELANDTQRTNEVSSIIGDNIKKNIIAFLTFFFTVLVFNTISTGKIDNIFTNDISILGYLLLFTSFLFLLLSIYEVYTKTEKYKKNYKRLKERYTDILDKTDINRVLNDDNEFKENIKSIKDSSIMNSLIWILIIETFALVITYLHSSYLSNL